MGTVLQDTFTRANVASGFGTATDGNTWTIQSGNGQSVASNEGQLSSSAASSFATLGAALTGADAEGLVRFQVKDITHNTAGILLRWTDASNHWLARFNGADALGPAINVMVKVAGTYTSQASKTLASLFVTLNNTSFYWLRFNCQGTTISLKIWQDGTSEPVNWSQQFTGLTSQNVAGKAGLYGFASGANPTFYDSYSVDDLAGTAHALSATVASGTGASAALKVDKSLHATMASGAGGSALLTVVAPTGIGDITRTTGTQTANKSGNGYGIGDITGTEYDYAYTDANGSGWAVGVNPWYGGMPVSAWYQIDPGLNTTLPQKTSANGNQMTLLTTQSGGIVHWEEAVAGTFQASELPTFSSAGNFTELAPANTAFRAYVQCIGDATDSNGIAWTAYACIYPGDPGFVVFRLDQHNPSGAGITFNESDIELIASLLGDTGHNPAGVWQVGNGNLSTIGGAATAWGSAGAAQTGTFDYAWITPDTSQSTIILGTGAAVLQPPQTQFGWEATAKYETNDSGPNATKPTRIKFGWYSPTITYTLAAGATNTYYVLRVFSRGLTQARMDAIAADWKTPGTPTASVGSYTAWRVDERAYEFAASNNHLAATLSLSGTGVVARFKPVVKVTGWVGAAAPSVTWGGSALTAGVDYRYVVDATNHILYLQLYFDVVSSGAVAGQRNNAALDITGPQIALSATFASGAGQSARLTTEKPLAATVGSGAGVSHPMLMADRAMRATVASGTAASARLVAEKPLRATIASGAGITATLTVTAGAGTPGKLTSSVAALGTMTSAVATLGTFTSTVT